MKYLCTSAVMLWGLALIQTSAVAQVDAEVLLDGRIEVDVGRPEIEVEVDVGLRGRTESTSIDIRSDPDWRDPERAPAGGDSSETELAPRHQRTRTYHRNRVQERPRWSLLAALTVDSTKWVVGDVERSGVAGFDLTSRLSIGERDVWTVRTGSRNFGVGFSETTVPMMTGLMHTIASGTGYLELGVEAGAYLDFGNNRDVAADFAMSARLSLLGHSRALRMGVYVDFFSILRLAPRSGALALGGGMTVGFTFDRYRRN